ncbi:MAG: hypothetical protein A2086_16720 [Spirochaetes bacterium GWD1_27_9]|nr:MAG: hypothetical protein A2Z98_00575 [Spirochaetes bacterium GWB1_27_13]OHD20941.1 MAG: hypothetical protein A2Y34_11960 [Spirochaetes bacterium GWC1_27_15]OHD31156.1 MAG: hypothetical protein A2086_16720 [Spirochaetes bacterium GWD1_27_9]
MISISKLTFKILSIFLCLGQILFFLYSYNSKEKINYEAFPIELSERSNENFISFFSFSKKNFFYIFIFFILFLTYNFYNLVIKFLSFSLHFSFKKIFFNFLFLRAPPIN